MAGKTLAELRAEAGTTKRLPTRSYDLCLAQDLIARVQELSDERKALVLQLGGLFEAEAADDEAPPKTPGRLADPRRTRVTEIDAELKSLGEEMREHSGRLLLTGISGGQWRRWIEANPPRETGRDEEGRPIINPVDDRYAYGFCNAQALAEDLLRYVTSWNDEPVTAEDWEFISENASAGDIKELVTIVVGMHEAVGARAPKSLSTSSPTTETAETS